MMLLFFSYKNKTPNVYLKPKLNIKKKKKKTNSYSILLFKGLPLFGSDFFLVPKYPYTPRFK